VPSFVAVVAPVAAVRVAVVVAVIEAADAVVVDVVVVADCNYSVPTLVVVARTDVVDPDHAADAVAVRAARDAVAASTVHCSSPSTAHSLTVRSSTGH